VKALVYLGPGQKEWKDVPDPVIQQPTDVIVKIIATTICGTDLHILKGDVPAVTPGRILGHEGVGTITEIGSAVTTLAVGDRVILSCISACGKCGFCKKGMYSHCLGSEGAEGIGWIFGHLIDGTQAELVRVPYAETSVYKLPATVTPEQGTLLSDILPTGHEIGIQYGNVKAGDVVAVVGAGPVGLAAIATAGLYGPSRVIAIDLDANRVDQAKKFGATDGVVATDPDWKEQVVALTDGLGVDVSVEAVGIPETFTMAVDIVRPGGHVASGGTSAPGSVDRQYHDHDGPGEHRHLGDAAEAGRAAPDQPGRLHQSPFRAVRHPRGVRRVRAGRGDEGAQGHPQRRVM
jgi:alcohol dehydrogenase